MKILMVTSEWPTRTSPEKVPFLVNEVMQLRKSGLEIEVYSFSGKKSPIKYFKEWIHLRQNVDLTKFDIIHAEWGQSALLALPKRLPLVITFRGSDLEGIVNKKGNYTFSGKLLRFISYNMALIADQVIIVSESLAKLLPSVPHTLLPVCLDTNVFKPMDKILSRKELGLTLEEKLILFPSNPDRPEKRYPLAKKAVDLLGSGARIIVTRNVPHTQMMLYYNACDVMIITSTHEGSPTVVYEALACNLPIVSVDVGDVQRRVGDIKGCYICKKDSPEEISRYLDIVLENPNRINSSSRVEEFNTTHFCETMKNIYESCL